MVEVDVKPFEECLRPRAHTDGPAENVTAGEGAVWEIFRPTDVCTTVQQRMLTFLEFHHTADFCNAPAVYAHFAIDASASTPPGMPGTHPPNILVGGRQREYPANIITYFRI